MVYSIMLLLTAGMVINMHGCEDQVECNIPCIYGTCNGSNCVCNTGYDGDSCSELTTQKFIGEWDAVDSCQTNIYTYSATIAASASVLNQIKITNLGRFGSSFTVTADVLRTTITIPDQHVQGIKLSGSGSIEVVDSNRSIIYITYFAEDEFHNSDQCSGVWVKAD